MSTTNERSQNDIVVGDGVVTVIPYQFNYFEDVNDNIEIVVTKKDTNVDPEEITVLVEGTDYDKYDDRVELTNPLLVGELLLVERVVVDVQPYDYQSMRPFPAEVHEKQEDRTFMSLSELKNKFKRTPMFNKFNEEEILIEDPIDGNFLKFVYDSDEDKWLISSDQSTIDLSDYYTKQEVDQLQSDQDTALQNYADQAETDAINAAASYTDGREIAIRDDVNNALDDKVDKGGIVAGSNINITGSGSAVDPIEISTSGIGEDNDARNDGQGEGLVLPKDGITLPFKGIDTQNPNLINIDSNATDVLLDIEPPSDTEENNALGIIKRTNILSQSAMVIPDSVQSIASNSDGTVIIRVTSSNVFRSTDSGATWSTLSVAGPFDITEWNAVEFATDGSDTFLVIGFANDLGNLTAFTSVDGGDTWTNATANASMHGYFTGLVYEESIRSFLAYTHDDLSDSVVWIFSTESFTDTGTLGDLNVIRSLDKVIAANNFGGLLVPDVDALTWAYVDQTGSRLKELSVMMDGPSDSCFWYKGKFLVQPGGELWTCDAIGNSLEKVADLPGGTSAQVIYANDNVGVVFNTSTSPALNSSIAITHDFKTWTTYDLGIPGENLRAKANDTQLIVYSSDDAYILDFEISKSTGWVLKKKKPFAIARGVTSVGSGSGALMNPPEGSLASATTFSRILNDVLGYDFSSIISLRPYENGYSPDRIVIKKDGWYKLTGFWPAYRTNRSDYWLSGTDAFGVSLNSFAKKSVWADDSASGSSVTGTFSMIVKMNKGSTVRMTQYVDVTGVDSQAAGSEQWCDSNGLVTWAELHIEYLGE